MFHASIACLFYSRIFDSFYNHRKRLVNKRREPDQRRLLVQVDQLLAQSELDQLDQNSQQILKMLNRDLGPDQKVMVKLQQDQKHQDLTKLQDPKVAKILRLNKNNQDQDQEI